ncbi:MarR family winged helix-turn-helix transcriptional regulator [Niveispirillum sp.]|uniref:MarR family winged helix-turn-helix transcriptional regulator n=1 Tax=Niveispirillum sp. TaxID=1917217 RepID=UPI001B5D6F09|nr:MarR family transcriptional regulator [Niveispirillum sp.]MBP7335169.1 MarR family transcriptional regulator [Niveispirillum sp.]
MSSHESTLNFGAMLTDTSRLLRKRFDQRLRFTGSTRAQWHAIFKISKAEGMKQAELADALDVEPITLTRLLDRMEEGGWVVRQTDPNDRRARLLYLTEKAHEALAPMRALADDLYEEALHGLDKAERDQLMHLLSRVRTNLSKGDDHE